MGSEILVYLRLGFEHIADPRGYDHILFIVALTAMYPPREWLRVLVLVTAFTVGHTITLALATFRLVHISTDLVEFLIPVTIVTTAVLNMAEMRWNRRHAATSLLSGSAGASAAASAGAPERPVAFEPRGGRITKYVLALCFGLIHGLGFSNFLRAALGAESSIAVPLLSFNVGLELGQVAIVASVMAVTGLMTGWLKLPRRGWTLVLSGAVGVVAVGLVVGRWPF